MAIILRENKGSELTFAEVDGNFSTLLYDVTLQGSVLNFYSNNGADVLKRAIDLGVEAEKYVQQFELGFAYR